MPRPVGQRAGWTLALAIASLAAVAVLTGVGVRAQRLAEDALLRIAHRMPPPIAADSAELAIVAIDPVSLRAVGQWPWPRERYAEAVRALDAAGAAVIAFDIDFSTPSEPASDAAFAAAVAESGRVALATFRQTRELPGGVEIEIANRPLPALAEAAAAVGSVLLQLDADGAARRLSRTVPIAERPTPSLAAVAISLARGEPTDARGSGDLVIDYRRAAPPIPEIPMIDVLDGRFEPERIAGRVVLVGATAAEFQDLWSTPLGPARPGVWIQAVAARTLAAERAGHPVLAHASPEVRIALALLLSLMAANIGIHLHGRRVAALALLALGVVAGALGLLVTRGLLVEPVVPLAVIGLHYVAGLEGLRRAFGERLAQRELSLTTLFRVGESTVRPGSSNDLEVGLALLGDVVDASGVALLRASGPGGLDGRRLEWRRRGEGAVGDAATAAHCLEEGDLQIFEGVVPGSGRSGVAVYTPLVAGEEAVGVLVVERDGNEPLDDTALRTIATVGTQLALSAQNLRLLDRLRATLDSSVEAVATAIEARDGYTESHCRRLAIFSARMGERLGLPPDEIEALRLGALLHDVGKIGIRDAILLKPGRFTPEERTEMERHTVIGHHIISGIVHLGETTRQCVRHHHERWDGNGYPDRLAGDDIPLGARIVSVVDVWDALSTARPYKPAMPQDKVRSILVKDRGTHFDPAIVDLFLEVLDEEGDEMLALLEDWQESP